MGIQTNSLTEISWLYKKSNYVSYTLSFLVCLKGTGGQNIPIALRFCPSTQLNKICKVELRILFYVCWCAGQNLLIMLRFCSNTSPKGLCDVTLTAKKFIVLLFELDELLQKQQSSTDLGSVNLRYFEFFTFFPSIHHCIRQMQQMLLGTQGSPRQVSTC